VRTVTADAFEDDTHPEGGRVVVLLRDVSPLPPACEFRIKPSDQETALDGWPKGVLKPLGAKATAAGLELVIGPEVTGSSVLVPGTGVEIELPSASLRAEFVWPSVTTTRRQRRRSLVAQPRNGKNGRLSGADHLALVVPTPANGSAEVVRLVSSSDQPSGEASAPEIGATDLESSDTGTSTMSSSLFSKLDALDAIAGIGEAARGDQGKPAEPTAEPVAMGASAAPRQTPAPAIAADDVLSILHELKRDIVSLKQEQAQQVLPPGEKQLRDVLAELKRDIVGLRQEQTHQHASPADQQLRDVLAELKRDIVNLKQEQAQQVLPPGEQQLRDVLAELKRDIVNLKHEQTHQHVSPGEQQLRDALAELKRDIVNLKHEQVHDAAPREPGSDLYAMLRDLKHDIATLQAHETPATPLAGRRAMAPSSGILGFEPLKMLAFGVPLVALALFGVYNLVKPAVPAYQPSFAAPPAPVAQTVAQPVAAQSAVNPATPVYDALSSGTVSPRGVSVAGVDAAQALAKATSLLTAAGPQRDAEEARFWLKRYLAIAHADKPVIRAITQLGTVYAQPGNGSAPDYGKARDVWEISSALGDPVAMCFIGNLFEYGLGVALNKQVALSWYERARVAGGCNGLEEAVARMRL
jgi:hypothetical protein